MAKRTDYSDAQILDSNTKSGKVIKGESTFKNVVQKIKKR